MAANNTAILALIEDRLPDNISNEISPEDLRYVLIHLVNYIDQNAGSGGGLTPQQVQALINAAIEPLELQIADLEERVAALEAETPISETPFLEIVAGNSSIPYLELIQPNSN